MTDSAPKLNPSNELVVQIFKQAEGASVQVTGEKKTELYLRPSEIEALFRIHNVPKEDWPWMLERTMTLQAAANEKRPRHKTPPKTK